MDKALEQLLALWSLYKDQTSFPVSREFLLSEGGVKWLIQINTNPELFKFNDIALQLIKNSTKTG